MEDLKMFVKFVKGDKIKAITPVFGNEDGEIATIEDVDYEGGTVSYKFDDYTCYGAMSIDMFNEYFEKYEEKYEENTKHKDERTFAVGEERINWLLKNSEIEWYTVFDKCTVVSCKLPNGFVITESSACVDPDNYNEEMGIDNCLNRILDKVWELEGYLLQNTVYEDGLDDFLDDDFLDDLDDFKDPNCEKCEDHDCELNPNNYHNDDRK